MNKGRWTGLWLGFTVLLLAGCQLMAQPRSESTQPVPQAASGYPAERTCGPGCAEVTLRVHEDGGIDILDSVGSRGLKTMHCKICPEGATCTDACQGLTRKSIGGIGAIHVLRTYGSPGCTVWCNPLTGWCRTTC